MSGPSLPRGNNPASPLSAAGLQHGAGAQLRMEEKTMCAEERTVQIRKLNDELRCHGQGGRILLTRGAAALGAVAVTEALVAIASSRDFTEDNDPYGEHDFGMVSVKSARVMWKIDYYDETLTYGSPDPSDPTVTVRVMTVMLAEEY